MPAPQESIADLYAGLHGTPQGAKIEQATELADKPGRISRAFAEEVRRFGAFRANEPF